MKTVLPRQELQDALASAATVAGGRTPKQIFNCVKLATAGDRLVLTGTDGEAGLQLSIPALSVEREGIAVVAADRLYGIVRELSDIEVTLEVDERHCTIRGEGSEFRIFVVNPEDYPPAPQFEGDPDLVVDGRVLRRMIGMTIYAAARETSRYAINGVLWEKRGKKLFLVATDGRRLARAGGKIHQAGTGDFEAIVPAKALAVFEKVFVPPRDQDDWKIDVRVMPNQVLLRAGGAVLWTVLVEGHFPKYEDVIPPQGDKRARVARDELYGAVKRAALLTTEESRAVRLAFQADQLVITAQAPDHGEARVELPISFEGEPLEIGFNPAFLNDALRAMPYEALTFEMAEPFRPGLLCGEDRNEFLYVIMPVSLSN